MLDLPATIDDALPSMSVASMQRRQLLGGLGLVGLHGLWGCGALQAGLEPMHPFSGPTEAAVLRVTHDSYSVSHPRQHATLRLASGEQVARCEMAGDFGERLVIAEREGETIVVQEFDIRVKTEAMRGVAPVSPNVRARGKVAYSRLDRYEMERHQPEGRGVLKESSDVRVPIHFDMTIITLNYPQAQMQIWLEHLHRAYQVLWDDVSALHAAVSYSYYAFGKREFNLIRAVGLPEQQEWRALQALLIAKLIVGD